MNGRYLLDTGVAQRLAMQHAATKRRVANASALAIPRIAVGELYAGAYWYAHLHNSTKYLDLYDDLLRQHRDRLLDIDGVTIHYYAAIYAELRSKGQLIQTNDIWIAALARQHGLTLATIDGDISRIQDFDFERW